MENLKFRRSIYVVKDIQKGDEFNIENIKKIRPGYGLSTIYYEKVLGKKSASNLKKGTPLKIKNLNNTNFK